MILKTPSGEKLMEHCFRNIIPYQNGFANSNDSFLSRMRTKRIKQKSQKIAASLLRYFSTHPDIDLDELYQTFKMPNSDFWDRLFFYCVTFSVIRVMKESNEFDMSKCGDCSISLFTENILGFSNGNAEIVTLKVELLKEKLKMELLFVPVLFKNRR